LDRDGPPQEAERVPMGRKRTQARRTEQKRYGATNSLALCKLTC
jgi:hypothetical protein